MEATMIMLVVSDAATAVLLKYLDGDYEDTSTAYSNHALMMLSQPYLILTAYF